MSLSIKQSVNQALGQKKQERPIPLPPPRVAVDNTRVVQPHPLQIQDQIAETVPVKKGIATTLEGAGAGLAAGLVTAATPTWIGHAVRETGSKSIVKAGVSFGAATSVSILAGAITANLTLDKSDGASLGAGIGAVAGAAILGPALGLGIKGIAIGAATGVLMGAAGGLAGAIAAEKR